MSPSQSSHEDLEDLDEGDSSFDPEASRGGTLQCAPGTLNILPCFLGILLNLLSWELWTI